MNKIITMTLLAALGLTLTTTDAQAFGRRKKNKGCCQTQAMPVATNCGGCGSGYGMVGQPAMYATGGPVAMPMATTTAPVAVGSPSTITIMVPNADTQVWFEDTALPQGGKQRTFKTPALTEGQNYNYTIKAKWTDNNGKAMEKSLPVSVKAGQTATVDFVK